MRLLAIGDIHLERRKLDDIPALDPSFDVLICAGDLWEGEPEKAIQSVVALAQGKPSIVVPGNHDLYTSGPEDRRTIDDFHRLLRNEAERQNAQAHRELVTVLSSDDPVCELEQVRFVGVTLWTDWAQAGRWMGKIENEIAWAARARHAAGDIRSGAYEYGAIKTDRGGWTPYDAVAEHARDKAVLLDELQSFHDGPTVAITHHAPLADCVDVYRHCDTPWWTPAFYAADILPSLPEYIRPDVWVFGHVHAACDVQLGRTRAIANPIEGGQFNPNLVVDLKPARRSRRRPASVGTANS